MNKRFFFTGLAEELAVCARCGYCLSVCPTYEGVGWESASPRARVRLANQLHTQAEWGTDSLGMLRLYQCTLCSHCSQVCPLGIDLRQVWLAARQESASQGVAPAHLKQMWQAISARSNVFDLPNEERGEWLLYMDDAPQDLDQRAEAEIIYFVGCVSSFSPAAQPITEAFTRVMAAAGLDFAIMGEAERCCGYPLIAAGMLEEARALRQHNVAVVRGMGARMVVFNCPSCALTWREFYAAELPDVKLLHATELLANLVESGRLTLGEQRLTVTYHDPCDLGRNGQVYEAPRRVLTAIPGLRLVEAEENRAGGLCCGGGGDLEMTDPALAAQVAAKALNRLVTPGVEAIVTACPQCVRMFHSAAEDNGNPVEVLDVVQIMDRALQRS
jgi:heterodisulfide reductase subunit D